MEHVDDIADMKSRHNDPLRIENAFNEQGGKAFFLVIVKDGTENVEELHDSRSMRISWESKSDSIRFCKGS